MRGLWKLTWIEMKLVLREPLATFFTLLFPLLLLVLFGSVFGNAPSSVHGGAGFVDASVPAYTALILATSALLTLNLNLVAYRENGILRRFAVTPMRPSTMLAAQVAVMFCLSALGMALLVTVGSALFGLKCAGNPIVIGAAFIVCSLSLFSLGFVLGGVLPSVRTAQAVGMACFYPMIFLSGAAIPRGLLPEGVQRAALVLPLTHVVSLLEGLWRGESWGTHLGETAIILAVMAAGIGISIRTFRWE